jgi:hypothetical protein
MGCRYVGASKRVAAQEARKVQSRMCRAALLEDFRSLVAAAKQLPGGQVRACSVLILLQSMSSREAAVSDGGMGRGGRAHGARLEH